MLDELEILFDYCSADSTPGDYQAFVVEQNGLAKSTVKSRQLTYRHLVDLYGLNPEFAVFRIFRKLWDGYPDARPVLALTIALARDPILRLSTEFIQEKKLGDAVVREEIETILAATEEGRYSPASLKSIAQNINGSWTRAGYLIGKAKKYRSEPAVGVANLTFCLFLAYLEGATAQRLFLSHWVALLGKNQDQLNDLAVGAANRGLIVFMNAGGLLEVRFPEYLTSEEEGWRHE
ncbi:hypothetical protein GM173_02975 [Deefgea chitinilytica]|uniref:DUF1819 family protein n=2 Tax=Chitinibacteraceae TaxID=2897177 RepID=A0ABS2C8R2_9NEIS|nr:hypothetical protein [Deefgea chitinilytica]MBM9887767.1 hypothetical protein [Deefgea sp. CFH1-16]